MINTMDLNTLNTASVVTQCATITVMPVMNNHLSYIFLDMLPFCYVAIPLIVLDLYYGRKQAQYKYENNLSSVPCTLQRSIKMTIQKVFNYICWIFLSTSLSVAFAMPSLVFIIMGIIYGLEVLSLLNKFGESKGIDIDEIGMLKLVFKFAWSRITGNYDENFDDVVKRHKSATNIKKDTKNKPLSNRKEHEKNDKPHM